FALYHIAKRFKRPLAARFQHFGPLAVIEERIHCLLEHSFFILYNDAWGLQLHEPFKSVVPVDDPPVKIIEVRGCETAAVKRNKGSQIRGQYGHYIKDHPIRLILRSQKRFHSFNSFGELPFYAKRRD